MKKLYAILAIIIITLSIIIIPYFTFSQTNNKETENIAVFCKMWGFLKYYHPEVAKGETDWDKEFISRINTVTSLSSKQEISDYYMDWIKSLGKVEKCKKCDNNAQKDQNLDLSWINNEASFSDKLIKKLNYIRENRNQGRNHYVQQNLFVGNTSYTNEKEYVDSVYPSLELRLLSLARYWNIINYFFPYKYLTDQNWNDALPEMIPKFKYAKDTVSYHMAIMELVGKVDDSHAIFGTKYTFEYFGYKWAPFKFKIIDNKVIVTGFYNDSLCARNDIIHGDIFLSVDNKNIEEIIAERLKYIPGSNYPTKLRNFSYAIFNGNKDSVIVTFQRNGINHEKYLYRYTFNEFNYEYNEDSEVLSSILDNNIGYVNMGILEKDNVKQVLNSLKDTKAIIFDVRNYPKGTMYDIANFLNKGSVPFAKFSKPDMKYPGTFKIVESYNCGTDNRDHYKGLVVVLFNEETQSHAEFTVMALQTAPNVICIGSQTAGADGNVSQIVLPGNYKFYMTGIGVYYPDGRETQRIGIVPDIEVKPTLAGIIMEKDEVLEKAIEVINERTE